MIYKILIDNNYIYKNAATHILTHALYVYHYCASDSAVPYKTLFFIDNGTLHDFTCHPCGRGHTNSSLHHSIFSFFLTLFINSRFFTYFSFLHDFFSRINAEF